MRRLWIGLVLLLTGLLGWQLLSVAADKMPPKPFAAWLHIQGAIGPATQDYFQRNLDKAVQQGAKLVVLQMDTPGGLSASMRGIIKSILASPVPVLTFVAPSGARAASAGTYILYASHVAAMAPGTNLGAATPVQLGGGAPGGDQDKPKDAKKDKKAAKKAPSTAAKAKAVNDARAYIRSLAQLRKRNVQWAEQAVLKAESLSAKEALAKNVIDLIAADVPDLLQQAQGRQVLVGKTKQRIDSQGLELRTYAADWRTEFLSIITNPSVAYVLLLVGIYGLFFEFANPGFIVPGVIGGISLLIGLYALQLLPINYAGLALMLLGLALLVAEAFVPSFGILGIGGLVAFAIGSIMLMRTDMEGFSLPIQLILGVTVATGLFFLLLLQLIWRGQRRPVVSGLDYLTGKKGTMVIEKDKQWVKIEGEYWRAVADCPLRDGQQVVVKSISGLTVSVIPAGNPQGE